MSTDPVHGTTGGEEEEDSDNALIQDVDATKTIGVVMKTTTTTTKWRGTTCAWICFPRWTRTWGWGYWRSRITSWCPTNPWGRLTTRLDYGAVGLLWWEVVRTKQGRVIPEKWVTISNRLLAPTCARPYDPHLGRRIAGFWSVISDVQRSTTNFHTQRRYD